MLSLPLDKRVSQTIDSSLTAILDRQDWPVAEQSLDNLIYGELGAQPDGAPIDPLKTAAASIAHRAAGLVRIHHSLYTVEKLQALSMLKDAVMHTDLANTSLDQFAYGDTSVVEATAQVSSRRRYQLRVLQSGALAVKGLAQLSQQVVEGQAGPQTTQPAVGAGYDKLKKFGHEHERAMLVAIGRTAEHFRGRRLHELHWDLRHLQVIGRLHNPEGRLLVKSLEALQSM